MEQLIISTYIAGETSFLFAGVDILLGAIANDFKLYGDQE